MAICTCQFPWNNQLHQQQNNAFHISTKNACWKLNYIHKKWKKIFYYTLYSLFSYPVELLNKRNINITMAFVLYYKLQIFHVNKIVLKICFEIKNKNVRLSKCIKFQNKKGIPQKTRKYSLRSNYVVMLAIVMYVAFWTLPQTSLWSTQKLRYSRCTCCYISRVIVWLFYL